MTARLPGAACAGYQARNNMMEMRLGDLGFFYHSSIAEPAAVGIVRVVKQAYPDFTAWEKGGEYYDPRSKRENPSWHMVDVEYVEPLEQPGHARANARRFTPGGHGTAEKRPAPLRSARDAARVADRFGVE